MDEARKGHRPRPSNPLIDAPVSPEKEALENLKEASIKLIEKYKKATVLWMLPYYDRGGFI